MKQRLLKLLPMGLVALVVAVVATSLNDLVGSSRERFEGNVDIVYAVVPRSELARAVLSRQAALDVERDFFERAERTRRGSLTIIEDFSFVVFLKNNDLAHISGRLEVALPGQPTKMFEASIPAISQKVDSVYVIDGGSMSFGLVSREKTVKWIKISGH